MLCLSISACNAMGMAETPEDALQILDSKEDSIKITKILNSGSSNVKQGFYVFESEVENKTEWYVAHIVSNDLFWRVKEISRIGSPNENKTNATEANTFTAGLSNKTEDKETYPIIIDIPDNDYFVWIELQGK